MCVYCDTDARKSPDVKQTARKGRGSPVKDITNTSTGRQKSAKARVDFKPQLKVALALLQLVVIAVVTVIVSGLVVVHWSQSTELLYSVSQKKSPPP